MTREYHSRPTGVLVLASAKREYWVRDGLPSRERVPAKGLSETSRSDDTNIWRQKVVKRESLGTNLFCIGDSILVPIALFASLSRQGLGLGT